MSENPSDVEVCVRKLAWRGFWTAMRASTYTAHARRLARRGATSAALRKALHALELLRSPHVHRFWPGTFVDIVEGAKLVDELAQHLEVLEPGNLHGLTKAVDTQGPHRWSPELVLRSPALASRCPDRLASTLE